MNSTNSLAVILISVGIFFFFTKPMMAELSTALDQKQEYQDKLEKVRSIGEIQAGLQKKMEDISEEDRAKVDVLLPSDHNVVKFIADVDALAGKNGISIDDISYSEAMNNAGESVSQSGSKDSYGHMNVKIGFKSDYKRLKSFISDLESSLRIIDIRSIDVVDNGKGIYDYKINTEIYWLKN